MNRSTLRAALTEALLDTAASLGDTTGLDRCLNAAASDLSRLRPLVVEDALTVAAGTSGYAAPSGLLDVMGHRWGEGCTLNYWDAAYAGPKPNLRVQTTGGVQKVFVIPGPTAAQVAAWGSELIYSYTASYTLGDTDETTTIPDHLEHALLLRAQAEAARLLANKGITRPVTMHNGRISTPAQMTPAAWHKTLMEQFEVEARG